MMYGMRCGVELRDKVLGFTLNDYTVRGWTAGFFTYIQDPAIRLADCCSHYCTICKPIG